MSVELKQYDDMDRFFVIEGDTYEDLVDKMNQYHEGLARVIHIGTKGNTYIAIFDRALQALLTKRDIEEFGDGPEAILRKLKTQMSA